MQSLKIACSLVCVVALAGLARAAAEEEAAPPAQYEFNYAVNDPTTGDQKDQQETRNGDAVVGYYRTVDSDGYLRTVKYKADKVRGFEAEVIREPAPGGAPPVPAAVKVAAPIKAAPVVYTAPVVPAPAPVAAAPIAPIAPVAAPVAAPVSYYSYPYTAGYQQYGYQPYPYTSGYQQYGYQPYPYTAGYGYQAYPYTAAGYGYQAYPYTAGYGGSNYVAPARK